MNQSQLMKLERKVNRIIKAIQDEKDSLDTTTYMTCMHTLDNPASWSLWRISAGTENTASFNLSNGKINVNRYGTYSKVDIYIYKKELMEKDIH